MKLIHRYYCWFAISIISPWSSIAISIVGMRSHTLVLLPSVGVLLVMTCVGIVQMGRTQADIEAESSEE